MQIIHDHLHGIDEALPAIPLKVDRLRLAKRRWRGVAADGAEFGFDLTLPLSDGDVFHVTEAARYFIAQQPEAVLEVRGLADVRLGWVIGNLHFPLAVEDDAILVPDDPALRQLFVRERIEFAENERVFHPLGGAHSHGPDPHHH